MWGGRFSDKPDAVMEEINASIDFDQLLFRQDIAGSKAHAQMLADTGILEPEDVSKLLHGLDTILREIENGEFEFSRALEDIHMNVENRLREILGDVAGRLHTARSRNDQIATDFRLWVRDQLDMLSVDIKGLQLALATKAGEHADVIMPGFTHLQSAQPVTFGHHLLAYVEMFERDAGRLADCRARMNQCPLGAAALAGTSFPIDRQQTAKALGFDAPTRNSLDSVSDRDFALEALAALAIAATHLSRLSEELVIWCTAQFKFVSLSDKYTTGSSIMPQKRNPDAAELVRAKVGRITGALNALLMVMKGLPLTYSKDMQEDKEQTFDAFANFQLSVVVMTGMINDLQPNIPAMAGAAGTGFSTATDLADWLVRQLKLPFRDAHHITGALVAQAETKGVDLAELPLSDMQAVHAGITEDVYSVLSVENSVRSRVSFGGTAPQNVAAQAAAWLDKLSG